MHTETEADALVTEELNALTKVGRVKKKVLEGESSGRGARYERSEKGHNREIRRNKRSESTKRMR